MQYKPSKWVSGYKHGPAASYTQITRMGLFLNVATSKFEPLDSTWDNLHSGGMFISDDNKIYFRDETNKDIYINSNADNEITIAATSGVTISGGNLIIGTAGKGIDFQNQASPAAGMTSELLDRYETGTWTGVISDGSNNATMNGAATTGTYTRVGNLVTVTGYFLVATIDSVSGATRLTGLPFTVANNNRNYGGVAISYAESLSVTAGYSLGAYSEGNSTNIMLRLWDVTGGTSPLLASELTDGGGFVLTASYMVS
jgi:hypothetical protein